MNENNNPGGAQPGSDTNKDFNSQNPAVSTNLNASNSANGHQDINPQFVGMNSYIKTESGSASSDQFASSATSKQVEPHTLSDLLQSELAKSEHITVDLPGATPIPPKVSPEPKPITPPASTISVAQAPLTPPAQSSAPAPTPVAPKPITPPAPSATVVSQTFAKSTPPTYTQYSKSSETSTHSATTHTDSNSMSNKIWMISGIAALILILAGAGAYWYLTDSEGPSATSTATSTKSGGATSTKPNASKPAVNTGTKPAAPTAPSATTNRQKITDYIKQNINALSPVKASPAFVVEEITFDGPDRSLVRYSNGQTTYIAAVVATVDASGRVVVSSFTILEK